MICLRAKNISKVFFNEEEDFDSKALTAGEKFGFYLKLIEAGMPLLSFKWFRKKDNSLINSRAFECALKNISLEVEQGSVVALSGPPQSGKSTLIRMLARVSKISSGSVEIHGSCGMLSRDSMWLHPIAPIRNNLLLDFSLFQISSKCLPDLMNRMREFTDMDIDFKKPTRGYDRDEQAKIAIAKSLFLGLDILFIDGLLDKLDEKFRLKCIRTIKKQTEQKKTFIIGTNDRNIMESLCSRIILLNDGQIVKESTPEDIGKDEKSMLGMLKNQAATRGTYREQARALKAENLILKKRIKDLKRRIDIFKFD